MKLSYSSAFKRAYKKLNDDRQSDVDDCIKDVVSGIVNNDMTLKRKRRIKMINKFRRAKPPRLEATWSGDGRIVFYVDTKDASINFMYLGGHEVINKP